MNTAMSAEDMEKMLVLMKGFMWAKVQELYDVTDELALFANLCCLDPQDERKQAMYTPLNECIETTLGQAMPHLLDACSALNRAVLASRNPKLYRQ